MYLHAYVGMWYIEALVRQLVQRHKDMYVSLSSLKFQSLLTSQV